MTVQEPKDPTPREHAGLDDIDEEESRRRFLERLSDWSEPDAVKIKMKEAGKDLWTRAREKRSRRDRHCRCNGR